MEPLIESKKSEVASTGQKPFALIFSETGKIDQTDELPGSERFGDRVTVDYTKTGKTLDEDPHTDDY